MPAFQIVPAMADRRPPRIVGAVTRRSLGLLVLLATGFLVAHAGLVASTFFEDRPPSFACKALEVALYLVASLVVLRDRAADPASARRATVFIVATAIVLRLMLLFAPPDSTDINRYVWDGRVQAAGINPYVYVPADPALKFLRDDEIYPEINRADYAATIYPPLAQIVFLAVTRVSESLLAMKAAIVLWERVGVWAVMRLLRARGLPARRVLLYAWHPLPIWEFAGSGHVDAIALACVALALLAAARGRPALAGIALGGAALVKFFPVVIGPALYRRWDWRFPLAGLATIILLYLPYVGAGGAVFGFLGGYSEEEGLSDGSGIYLWLLGGRLMPLPAPLFHLFPPAAALLLGTLGLRVLWRRGGGGPDVAAALLLAEGLTALTSPHYPWYSAWLVPFLCFAPSPAVLYLTCGSLLISRLGWPPDFFGGSVLYGPFLVLAGFDLAAYLARGGRAPPDSVAA